jgi:hypothetical protein
LRLVYVYAHAYVRPVCARSCVLDSAAAAPPTASPRTPLVLLLLLVLVVVVVVAAAAAAVVLVVLVLVLVVLVLVAVAVAVVRSCLRHRLAGPPTCLTRCSRSNLRAPTPA